MIAKALKRLDDGTLALNVDPRPRPNEPRSRFQVPNIFYYDIDNNEEVAKEDFDKRVNRICYCMLCVMGTVLTVGFVIIIVTILLNKR